MLRSPSLRLAPALFAAALIALVPVDGASASTPPSSSDPTAAETTPIDPSTISIDPTQGEAVESWTLAPASSAEEVGNRPNLSYTIAPGDTVADKVTVYNLGNVPLVFRVYATDAFNNDDGTFALLAGDKEPVDVGTWLTLDQEAISVPPGMQTTIPFSITVPRDAAPGDHVGAVLASSATLGVNEDPGTAVTVDRRTGTRLFVRVAGDLRTEFGITNLESDYHHSLNSFGGSTTVRFRVENRGNVRLSGVPLVEVGGPFGAFSKTIKMPKISELLPGEHADLAVEVADVPALFVNSTKVSIKPEGEGIDNAPTSTASTTQFAPPITLLLLVLVVVLVLLALRARRRRAGGTARPTPQPPAASRELQHQ